MKAIFVTIWSLPTKKSCDEMLLWCRDNGFTDIFYQTGVINKGTVEGRDIDFIDYICKNKGKLRIHAHITTLLLWRDENYLTEEERPEIKNEWIYKNIYSTEGRWILDATNLEVQDYIVDKCTRITKENDIDGIYLERLYYHPACAGNGTDLEKMTALTTILKRVTKECKLIKPKLKVSVSVFTMPAEIIAKKQLEEEAKNPNAIVFVDYERLQDLDRWEEIVDYLMPMNFVKGTDFDLKYSKVSDNQKYITTIGCNFNTIDEIKRQLEIVGDNVAFYRYGFLSKSQDSKESFAEAINEIK